jgi:TolA-binding protein
VGGASSHQAPPVRRARAAKLGSARRVEPRIEEDEVMRIGIGLALATLLLPAAAFCQSKKELLEMNRDIALLQEEVRNLKKSNDDHFAAMDVALKQVLDQITSANRQVGVLDKGIKDRMDKGIGNQMTAVGSKVDSLAEDFRYVKENVTEIGEKLNSLQQKVVDLNNAIRTMQAPPPAPAAPLGSPSAAAPSGPPPGVTAESLYNDAFRDRSAKNYDLARREFHDYLTYFADTDRAPNAQYYLGDIAFNEQNFDEAIKAFDAVVAMPGKNNKLGDAHYMKGRALVHLGEKTAASKEFKAVIATPGADPGLVRNAQAALRDLGVTAPPARKRR